jgi:hypothetical protein
MSQKCTSWLGHKYEARYEIIPPSHDAMNGMDTTIYGMEQYLKALTKRVYLRDICVRCGHVVEKKP